MLSQQDNDILCRVGPGTPMGNLMRQYWIPAVRSDELPSPDCPPMRLRLLGENLIAFRTKSGSVGIVANACPHRGASLFFGRNEEDGLRCVYHGWKFDITGACVDMPSEPVESNFRSKVRVVAYPCLELNNIVWTYMGPLASPPPLPDHPGATSPDVRVIKNVRDCSYLQALEGDIDTVHFPFLHAGSDRHDEYPVGSEHYYGLRRRNAALEVRDLEAGASYGAYRQAEDDNVYWRMGHFLLPFYTYNASGILTQKAGGIVWVPIDDDHVMVWFLWVPRTTQPGLGGLFSAPKIGADTTPPPTTIGSWYFQPDTTDWNGKFHSTQTIENDYMIDRGAQSRNENYSGIPYGAEPQDRGMQESMGPIYDRTSEHLGTTDAMVIKTRQQLLRAAKALRDHGTVPPGALQPNLYRLYSGGALIPNGVSGLDYAGDILYGRRGVLGDPVKA